MSVSAADQPIPVFQFVYREQIPSDLDFPEYLSILVHFGYFATTHQWNQKSIVPAEYDLTELIVNIGNPGVERNGFYNLSLLIQEYDLRRTSTHRDHKPSVRKFGRRIYFGLFGSFIVPYDFMIFTD